MPAADDVNISRLLLLLLHCPIGFPRPGAINQRWFLKIHDITFGHLQVLAVDNKLLLHWEVPEGATHAQHIPIRTTNGFHAPDKCLHVHVQPLVVVVDFLWNRVVRVL